MERVTFVMFTSVRNEQQHFEMKTAHNQQVVCKNTCINYVCLFSVCLTVLH